MFSDGLYQNKKLFSWRSPDPLGFTIAVIFSISKAFYAVKIDIQSNGEVTNSYI